MNKENNTKNDATPTSVFELTKDLMEPEEPQAKSGLDWGWGDQDEEVPGANIDGEVKCKEPADEPSPETAAAQSWGPDEDSDATVEMDSDDEEEEESQPALETQPPLVARKLQELTVSTASAKADQPTLPTAASEVATDGNKGEDSKPEGPATTSKLIIDDLSSEDEASEPDREMQGNKPSPETPQGDDDSSLVSGNEEDKDSAEEEETTSDRPTSKPLRASRHHKQVLESSDEEDEDEGMEEPSLGNNDDHMEKGKVTPVEDEDGDADDEAEQKSMGKAARNNIDEETPPISAPRGEVPDEEDLLRSTDYLFVHADKDSVTVADICRALAAEYDCKIPKALRKLVRERLVDLMKGNITPEIAGGNDEEAQEGEEDEVSEQGDHEESDQSDFEQPADSDDEYQEETSGSKRVRKPKKTVIKKTKKKDPSKTKSKRPSQRKAAKAARMVEAERRRKKRMEELRVRNEEMQLNQSKEEQERAEAIAARLETNSDEARLKRIEDRLTLLELLDKKRIAVIDALESRIEEKNAASMAIENASNIKHNDKDETVAQDTIKSGHSDSEESSSDEEELDIIGPVKSIKPLKPIHTHMTSKAVNFLRGFRSPHGKKNAGPSKLSLEPSPSTFLHAVVSPTKKKAARGNLRETLKQKVRKQGNLWLARELGYKTEEDHLKDCQQVAKQKRILVRKMEQSRVEANERKLLRERILRQDEGPPGDYEEQTAEPEAEGDETHSDEENEELQMARELEMAATKPNDDVLDVIQEGHPTYEELISHEVDETQVSEIRDSSENKNSHVRLEENNRDANRILESQNYPNEDSALETQPPITSDAKAGPPVEHIAEKPTMTESGDVSTSLNSAKENESIPDVETPFDEDDDEGEVEFEESQEQPKEETNRPRNAAWQAMLKKEAEKLRKQKKNRKQGLVEDQAEEEEEEEVAGLEDFGFSFKKKKDDDDDDAGDDALDEDDLKHVVDEVSDNEGDEEAGEEARKKQERLEEQERHKEILRRMREGYDGRRGGIAGGGVGARGMHRFDQLVAADNREDAKRLGLLNDDELDSDNEGEKEGKTEDDNEEDEATLLDKILKDRFLHRTDVNLEENFSEDEEDPEETNDQEAGDNSDAEEERTQERLAKRFAKRARMQRLEEEFADSQEFSQQRLIDEDESMRQELSQMKNGLVRKRTISSGTRTSSLSSNEGGQKRPLESELTGNTLLDKSGGSLSIALRASRKMQRRTSFLGGDKAGKGKDNGAFVHKSVALNHVVFASALSNGVSNAGQKRKRAPAPSTLFSKARKAQ